MAEVFKRASKGAPIRRHLTSGAFNAFVDAANQVGNVQRGHISGAKQEQPASTVKVENGTGANLDRFSVIGLSAPAILDSEGSEYATRGLWSGVTPTADHLGKFAIYQEAVPAGFLGRAAVSGVVPCKLFVSASDGDVTHCDVDTSDSSRLETNSLGSARILWKSSTATDTTVDAVVCLHSPLGSVPFAAIAAEDIEYGTTGDADKAEAGSWESSWSAAASSGVTVYNPFLKIWSGARLIVQPATLLDASGNELRSHIISQHFSATQLIGDSTAAVAAGATGTIDTLSYKNGHFSPTSTSFVLPIDNHSIDAANVVVFARLVWTGSASQWIASSADCNP